MITHKDEIYIQNYQIIKKIGKGAFGKVYQVKDQQNNEFYAAKIVKLHINKHSINSEEAKILFREVNLISSFDHPAILKFIGYCITKIKDNTYPTLITELAKNDSLREITKRENSGFSPTGWDDTKKLINIYGIASGMSYLHKHNVIHRDLKPENILIDENFYPKIADFGLSKMTDNSTSVSIAYQSKDGHKGTYIYMSPETLMNKEYSKAGDVYSFAFIVFEIMTSEIPYKDIDNIIVLMKLLMDNIKPEIREDVPESYRNLINVCWSFDANERPSFDDIVSHLRNDKSFITETMNETEFLDYVDLIDSYHCKFDSSKRVIHFSKFFENQGENETDLAHESHNSSIKNKLKKSKEDNSILINISHNNQDKNISNKNQSKNQEKIIYDEYQQIDQNKNKNDAKLLKIDENENQPKNKEKIMSNEYIQTDQDKIKFNAKLSKIYENQQTDQKKVFPKESKQIDQVTITSTEKPHKIEKSLTAPTIFSKLLTEKTEAPPNSEEESPYDVEWLEEEKDRSKRTKKLYSSKEKSKFYKNIIRMGICNSHRQKIYLNITLKNKNFEDLRPFWPDVLIKSSKPKYENIVGLFGYPNYELFTPQSHLDDFLTIVKNQNHEIKFSPMIPCVASILQLFYDDFLSYIILQSMINEENEKYFVMNKENFIAMLSTIDTIIKLNKKKLYEHTKSIKLNFAIVSLFIVPILFSKKMKKNIVLTIFDSFMNEGRSVLIRYVIGFIIKLEADLLQSSTPAEFMTILFEYMISIHSPLELQQIVSIAFGTDFMTRKKINSLEKTERLNEHILNKHIKNQLPNIDNFYYFYANTSNQEYLDWRLNHLITIYANLNGGQLITSSQFWEIKKHLNSYFIHMNAYPIYNLSEDGSSFITFLRRAKSISPCMLLIKASSGTIGAFLANSIHPVNKKKSYGSAFTTVFELNNLKTYQYSHKNDNFLYVTKDSVAIGNGPTGCAIYFENGFDTVVSDPCETFDSPCLLGSQRENIENVELYKLAP